MEDRTSFGDCVCCLHYEPLGPKGKEHLEQIIWLCSLDMEFLHLLKQEIRTDKLGERGKNGTTKGVKVLEGQRTCANYVLCGTGLQKQTGFNGQFKELWWIIFFLA